MPRYPHILMSSSGRAGSTSPPAPTTSTPSIPSPSPALSCCRRYAASLSASAWYASTISACRQGALLCTMRTKRGTLQASLPCTSKRSTSRTSSEEVSARPMRCSAAENAGRDMHSLGLDLAAPPLSFNASSSDQNTSLMKLAYSCPFCSIICANCSCTFSSSSWWSESSTKTLNSPKHTRSPPSRASSPTAMAATRGEVSIRRSAVAVTKS
mmetsp:Transcript_14786/g.32633  ORF Transcript_14786/g.32633 Transcript_14786/m.32633 type:complete len:212 (+) Transcript_14786:884-1519(+)